MIHFLEEFLAFALQGATLIFDADYLFQELLQIAIYEKKKKNYILCLHRVTLWSFQLSFVETLPIL